LIRRKTSFLDRAVFYSLSANDQRLFYIETIDSIVNAAASGADVQCHFNPKKLHIPTRSCGGAFSRLSLMNLKT